MKWICSVFIALTLAGCSRGERVVYVDSKEAQDKGMEVIAQRQRDLAESDKMLDRELEAIKNKSSTPKK